MAITFTDGTPPKGPMNPAQKPEKKMDPKEQENERQRKRLQIQQKQIQKKIDTLKTSIAQPIRNLAGIIAADPNDDPNELFSQVRPLLTKMGIANMSDPSKTELVTGKTQGTNSLYKVTLRRGAQLSSTEIDRIKRQEKALETIQWSAQAMEVFLWWPYKAPEEAPAPGTPPTPGAPTPAPGASA
jgi:hypothetical protein